MRRNLILILLALSGCVEWEAWPTDATIRVEMDNPTHTTSAQWHKLVHFAVDQWAQALGDDCPFPYAFDANGSHVIRLIGVDHWPHDKHVGMAFPDRIEIKDGIYDVRTAAIIMHELGHAFGLEHVSEGSKELMAPDTAVNYITERDLTRAREALGCQ